MAQDKFIRHTISAEDLATKLGFEGCKVQTAMRVPKYGKGEVEFVICVEKPDTHESKYANGPCPVCGACIRCAVGEHEGHCHGCRCACNAPYSAPEAVRCGGPCRVDAAPAVVAS